MKTRLRIAAITVLILSFIHPAMAQPKTAGSPPAPVGLPPAVDPATGLPISTPPEWKDANWKDPNKVIAEVNYDALPVAEVARAVREQFTNAFDVLITPWNAPRGFEPFDPSTVSVRLELRNVTASEIFNAMNLMFENENDPVRWKLIMNGDRPMAILKVIPDLMPFSPLSAGALAERQTSVPTVFFVGNLVGDQKSGGMTMDQVISTITSVWSMNYNSTGAIQFHKDAQLMVVTGTPEQTKYVSQVLNALGQKVLMEQNRKISGDLKAQLDTARGAAAGGGGR